MAASYDPRSLERGSFKIIISGFVEFPKNHHLLMVASNLLCLLDPGMCACLLEKRSKVLIDKRICCLRFTLK